MEVNYQLVNPMLAIKKEIEEELNVFWNCVEKELHKYDIFHNLETISSYIKGGNQYNYIQQVIIVNADNYNDERGLVTLHYSKEIDKWHHFARIYTYTNPKTKESHKLYIDVYYVNDSNIRQ